MILSLLISDNLIVRKRKRRIEKIFLFFNEKERNMKKILFVVAAIYFALNAKNILPAVIEQAQAEKEYSNITVVAEKEEEQSTAKQDEELNVSGSVVATREIEVPEEAISADLNSLYEVNEDLVGVLYIPDIELMLPVAQGDDNDYYLHHTFEGTKSMSGCLMLDKDASLDDPNKIIYGHNMRSGKMFGSLDKLLTAEGEKKMYLYTFDGCYVYTIFSCFVTEVGSDAYASVNKANAELYYNTMLGLNTSGMTAPSYEGQNMLTLSTCHGKSGTSGRLIVNAICDGIY